MSKSSMKIAKDRHPSGTERSRKMGKRSFARPGATPLKGGREPTRGRKRKIPGGWRTNRRLKTSEGGGEFCPPTLGLLYHRWVEGEYIGEAGWRGDSAKKRAFRWPNEDGQLARKRPTAKGGGRRVTGLQGWTTEARRAGFSTIQKHTT